jgi:hypothetical protein
MVIYECGEQFKRKGSIDVLFPTNQYSVHGELKRPQVVDIAEDENHFRMR